MAYYCRKCRRWHQSGAIAQRHKIFSARPTRSSHKPRFYKKTKKPRQTKRKTKKLSQKAPLLILTKKKPIVKPRVSTKPKAPRKAKIGLSKMRRGQLAMRPGDMHEKGMVKRLRAKTGMTHIQVMNLVNLAKKSDYIDVETEIMGSSGHSRDKTETYEYAKRNIMKKLERHGMVTTASKYNDEDYFDQMQDDYMREREWERTAKKWRRANLI